MNHNFVSSLKHIVLFKTASALWNCKNLNDGTEWDKIEKEIREKVPLLPLPEPLKENILCIIKPIGNEIWKWKRDKIRCGIDEDFHDELFWTPQGALDRKKTAEAKMKDETIDITKRFVLACNYCLENDVGALWKKMSASQRSFLIVNHRLLNKFDMFPLVLFWTMEIKRNEARMENGMDNIRWHNRDHDIEGFILYQYAFEDVVRGGNKVAAEYFWNKLAPEEKEEALETILYQWTCVHHIKDDATDIFPFLLSQVNEEQQLKMYQSCLLEVLLCFLEWPRQNMFIEMTNHIWEFLDDRKFYSLLEKIVDKIYQGYKDCDYEHLFKVTWQKSDIAHKKYIIEQCVTRSLLSHLLDMKCIKIIALILKDATVEEKENIFFNDDSYFCRRLVRKKKWGLLKFFIIQCVPSREKMVKFKDECKQNSTWTESINNEDLQIFFQLLDELIQKWNEKRSTE